ncbi:MAG TPA: phosphatase PAP2 family protein [Roseomonas sp.]|nr:phosphatase PAP2 family protein [Roseomonas sp.]
MGHGHGHGHGHRQAGGAGGVAAGGSGFDAVPPELGYREITLQFQLGLNAPPAFPLDLLPEAVWRAGPGPGPVGRPLPMPAARTPPTPWDDSLYGLLGMGDFAAADPGWQDDAVNIPAGLADPPNPPGNLLLRGWDALVNPVVAGDPARGHVAFVAGEIEALRRLMAQDRERYMAEILAQQNFAPDYWVGLLNMSRSRTPWTIRLMFLASRVAELVVMRAKLFYDRPRPSHVCPALSPPYGPPAHPSFPSAHSAQSFLIAHCLTDATRAADGISPYAGMLIWLARRIAHNRERGGFHYRSDTLAGEWLAQKTLVRLLALADGTGPAKAPVVEEIFRQARAEWQ